MTATLRVCALILASSMAGNTLAADAAAGKTKSATCAACHGPDGNSAVADFPRIAGQYPDYIVKSLTDYKSGARKNPIMAPMAAMLSERDMEDLAAFFSQQNGLVVKE